MNEEEFKKRVLVNPNDQSADFLTAAEASSSAKQLLEQALQFEDKLKTTIQSVSASEKLKASLMNPESLEQRSIIKSPPAANDDSFWKRVLPFAACIIIAVGIAFSYSPSYSPTQKNINHYLGEEVLAHIRIDIDALEANNHFTLSQVNQHLESAMGKAFELTPAIESLDVNLIDDCWIAEQNSIHMVMEGNVGKVTVILIPSPTIQSEFTIADERFNGIITPTSMGNLVIVGEKQEPILDFKNLLASNMSQ